MNGLFAVLADMTELQEELFKAHGMQPPRNLQDFCATLCHTTPVKPGQAVQEEVDDDEDIVPSDQELPSDDEVDDAVHKPQRAPATTTARADRIRRRAAVGTSSRQTRLQASSASHVSAEKAPEDPIEPTLPTLPSTAPPTATESLLDEQV